MKLRLVVAVGLLLLSCTAVDTARGADVANWIGGAGLWSDATKWSGGVVPANNGGTTYSVNIDNGNATASNVTLQGGGSPRPSIALDALTIDTGDSLAVRDYTLAANALMVNGQLGLRFNGTVNLPPGTTVGGTGTIEFINGQTQLGVSTGTFTIDNGMTITGGRSDFDPYYVLPSGVARLGSSGAAMVNRGTIHVHGLHRHLVASGSTIENQGTFRVSDGGRLTIDANFSLDTIGNLVNDGGEFVITKTLDNVGQTLRADHPRGWVLAGGRVNGGTVSTTGPGYIYVPYLSSGTLTNVTLDGDVHVNGNLSIAGTFAGSGTIKIANPEAIEGSGIVSVNTVPAGVTIRGGIDASFADPMKARVFTQYNAGTIRADRSVFGGSGTLRIAMPLMNTGSLEITDGGTLHVENDLTFSDNGKLVVDGGGLLEVRGNLFIFPSAFASLEVLPKAGGDAYDNDVIATYTGSLRGTFDDVTPGISVSYTFNQIIISGTPVPEPALLALTVGVPALLAGARRRRRP